MIPAAVFLRCSKSNIIKLFELQGQLLEMIYEKEINEGMFDEN